MGMIFKKKNLYPFSEPGPGSYDIPNSIAFIPNYLLNSNMNSAFGTVNSKFNNTNY